MGAKALGTIRVLIAFDDATTGVNYEATFTNDVSAYDIGEAVEETINNHRNGTQNAFRKLEDFN